MRYLCTNPDCSAFARLIAGFRPTCPACGQRVLDERVMLKHGRSVQSIVASKGRAGGAPAPVPRPVTAGVDPPTWGEETRLRGKRDEELRQILPPDKLAAELQENTIGQVARKYGKPHAAIETLLREYGLSVRGLRKAAGTPEPGHMREVGATDAFPRDLPAEPVKPESSPPPAPVPTPAPPPPEQAEAPAKLTGAKPPATTRGWPGKSGFQFQIRRSGEAKPTVVGDIDALAAAVEHLQEGGLFNLTVILEEAS